VALLSEIRVTSNCFNAVSCDIIWDTFIPEVPVIVIAIITLLLLFFRKLSLFCSGNNYFTIVIGKFPRNFTKTVNLSKQTGDNMEEEELEKIKLYRFVGYAVFVITLLGFLAMGGTWFYFHNTKVDELYVEFPYIGDLRLDDPFTLNGYHVGMVKGIKLIGPSRVILKINLRVPVEIREGYNLLLGDLGIFGERLVSLENGPPEAPLVNPGDTLSGEYFMGISDMLGKMMELRDLLDTAMVFVGNLQHGNDTAKSLMEWVGDTKNTLDRFFNNLHTFSSDIDNDLPKILEKIGDLSNTLNTDLRKFDEKLPDILDKTSSIIDVADTMLVNIAKIQRIGDDVQNFVDVFDSIDVQMLNQTLTDIQKELGEITSEAHKLRLWLRRWR